MKNLILSLADRVLQGGSITCQEAEQLIDVSDDDTMLLLAMADRIRQKFTGDAVDCCAIINGRSGRCLKIVNFVLSQPIIILVLKNIHC
jgi:biotin synthase